MADRFYVALDLNDGQIIGHSVSMTVEGLEELDKPSKPADTSENAPSAPADATTFLNVFNSFASVMTTYRNFLQFTLGVTPLLLRFTAERSMGDFAKSKGAKRDDLSTDSRQVFELRMSTWREFAVRQDDLIAGMQGARHLPEVMVIGLLSAYDAFLGKLLRVIFMRHEAMILTSEKAIKFSDLSHFKSIEDARHSLIDREIESVLRESHQEHFKWMETKFDIPLRKNLASFSKFIELCERRNLLTHTGGIVSGQYLANCKAHGVDLKNVELGSKLTVTPEYYSNAVDIVCEIGIKLCYVLWRKFNKDEREQADELLNEFCYDLVVRRHYAPAEAILSFTTKVLAQKGSDRCRRMMLINQANAVRLQKREPEAIKLLDAEDWSAVSDDFKVSVAAIRGDIEAVVSLIEKIGSAGSPTAEAYRTWPVFRGIRNNAKVAEAFQSVFGEPLIHPKLTDVKVLKERVTEGAATPEKGSLH